MKNYKFGEFKNWVYEDSVTFLVHLIFWFGNFKRFVTFLYRVVKQKKKVLYLLKSTTHSRRGNREAGFEASQQLLRCKSEVCRQKKFQQMCVGKMSITGSTAPQCKKPWQISASQLFIIVAAKLLFHGFCDNNQVIFSK